MSVSVPRLLHVEYFAQQSTLIMLHGTLVNTRVSDTRVSDTSPNNNYYTLSSQNS